MEARASDARASRTIHVAIGVDCDPDRDTYPTRLTWRGIEALPRLLDIPDVRWTLNVRADTQIRDRCGSVAFCLERYDQVWRDAAAHGSQVAWHLHYFGADGRQDVSDGNIHENVELGATAFGRPRVVHMGWTFQNDVSLRALARVGVEVDYSPVPRMRHRGRRGVDAYDWWHFPYRPQFRHGIRMIPAFSYRDPVLSRRFQTERVLLTTTTHPFLFRRLLASFFASGSDYLVSYFHADEIADAVGGWRNGLYGFDHLKRNLAYLRQAAEREGYEIRYCTIGALADVLFP